MIYENNEEKRNTLWRTVLSVSSVIIIIIVVFFVVRLSPEILLKEHG